MPHFWVNVKKVKPLALLVVAALLLLCLAGCKSYSGYVKDKRVETGVNVTVIPVGKTFIPTSIPYTHYVLTLTCSDGSTHTDWVSESAYDSINIGQYYDGGN